MQSSELQREEPELGWNAEAEFEGVMVKGFVVGGRVACHRSGLMVGPIQYSSKSGG